MASLTTPLLLPSSFTNNPLADASVVIVADWAHDAAADGASLRARTEAPPRAPVATRFGCDLFAAALAHAAAFWGMYAVCVLSGNPATKLAATLTYHLAAVATGSALLAAVCDATGPHATRHVAAVAVVGALFCVQWGAFTCLLFKAASAV